jgi:hypothetical protein
MSDAPTPHSVDCPIFGGSEDAIVQGFIFRQHQKN